MPRNLNSSKVANSKKTNGLKLLNQPRQTAGVESRELFANSMSIEMFMGYRCNINISFGTFVKLATGLLSEEGSLDVEMFNVKLRLLIMLC